MSDPLASEPVVKWSEEFWASSAHPELAQEPTDHSNHHEDEDGINANEDHKEDSRGTMLGGLGGHPEEYGQRPSAGIEHVGEHTKNV